MTGIWRVDNRPLLRQRISIASDSRLKLAAGAVNDLLHKTATLTAVYLVISAMMSFEQLTRWPARYELLDGLRGFACLGVLLHHLGVTTFGHYAVMIFFVISGYCITASAQSCIRQDVPFTKFMLRRVKRIYPPYLFALLYFASTRVVKMMMADANSWHPSALYWLQNLTLTQWMSIPFNPIAWPSDNPSLFVAAFWSLNYEEQFYLVTGLALFVAQRFKFGLNRTVLILFVAGVAWNLRWPGGWVTGFFIEYWAHFALGSAVYFVLCEYPSVRARCGFFFIVALLSAYCVNRLIGMQELPESMKRVFIEIPVLAAFSGFLVLVRPLSAAIGNSILWRPFAALGVISFSLYLVHQFNLTFVEAVVRWLLPPQAGIVTHTIGKVAVHIGIASLFWYACERPFLSRRAELPPPTDAMLSKGLAVS